MKSYKFSMTTRVYYGDKCVEEAVKKEKDIIGNKPLLITTSNKLKELGFVRELCKWIDADVIIYDKVTPNPDVVEIRKAIEVGKEQGVSSVIGFGGGSAIDAAKAVAIGIVSNIDIEDFLIKELSPPENTLPIIAIPTTSGTGAELSKGAIISCKKKKIKSGIRGEKITPTVAIVDPTYTFSLPLSITMETGFDVLAHAVESYCAIKANSFSEMLSERAIKIVGEALPRLNKNLSDIEARELMSFASHIMGYNVKSIGNCLPHRLQYPIGVTTETSHGAGLIALYPAWIKHESKVRKEKVDIILEWLGCKAGKPDERIKRWLDDLEISRTITDLGNTLTADELGKMVTGNLKNDKLAEENDIIIRLYQEAM